MSLWLFYSCLGTDVYLPARSSTMGLHQALILLSKCLIDTGPTYIGSIFKHRLTPYRLKGEGLNLELPKFNLKLRRILLLIH